MLFKKLENCIIKESLTAQMCTEPRVEHLTLVMAERDLTSNVSFQQMQTDGNIQYFDGLLNPEFSINIQFEFYQYKSQALNSTL
jgi:hypothetical protein